MASNLVKFFSYVVKENFQGLQALFGRKNLLSEDAVLQGYELCIQTVDDVSDEVSPTSPIGLSPQEILRRNFKPDYELYTIRAKPGGAIPGKIWYISPHEYEYLREYELIDYGLSEDITAVATTERGDRITVSTYGLVKNADKITKVVDVSYIREELPTPKKLHLKRRIRLDYIKRKRAGLRKTPTTN